MVIRRGDIWWVNFSPSKGSEPAGRRPGLVIQCDALNESRLNTVVMASITSNLKFSGAPGNVALRKGESNMPRPCVINVTQLKSVDRASLKEKIGNLSDLKMEEVVEGLKLVMDIA